MTGKSGFRFRDFMAILVCLLFGAGSCQLFLLNYYQTLFSNNEYAGKINDKRNSVQRRISDRVLWDRLKKDSTVYVGDMIRTAKDAHVILDIPEFDAELFSLPENTLMRIHRSPGGKGPLQLDIISGGPPGNFSVGKNGGKVIVKYLGYEHPVGPGDTLGAADFLSIQNNEPEREPGVQLFEKPAPVPKPAAEPRKVQPLSLEAPAAGEARNGLRALRQQTEFRWNTNEEVKSSRFLLSRNPNPSQGRPEVVVINPDRIVRIDRLDPGFWYWTVEAETPDGLSISAEAPRLLRVLPVEPLPAPVNRRPAGRITLDDQPSIVFSWSPVRGANAYIFTLLQVTANRRRTVISVTMNRTSFTMSDPDDLEQGAYLWQVEAVYRNSDGTIEQHGRIGENSIVVDIPVPAQPQLIKPGILYGN